MSIERSGAGGGGIAAPIKTWSTVTITPPTGKRLVIEAVAATLSVPAGQTNFPNLVLNFNPGSNPYSVIFPSVSQGTMGGQDFYGMAHATKLYATAGTTVTVSLLQFGPLRKFPYLRTFRGCLLKRNAMVQRARTLCTSSAIPLA